MTAWAMPIRSCALAAPSEAACGYVPTDQHIVEGDTNLADWSWVALGSEARMLEAIRAALSPK